MPVVPGLRLGQNGQITTEFLKALTDRVAARIVVSGGSLRRSGSDVVIAPARPFGGVAVYQMTIVEEFADYLECHRSNSLRGREGSVSEWVGKPSNLRGDIATRGEGEEIYPPYAAGEVLYAVEVVPSTDVKDQAFSEDPGTGTGAPARYIDLNIDARIWVVSCP